MSIAAIYVPVIIGLLIVGAITFMIAAASDRRSSGGALAIKSVYVSLVTLVSLAIVVTSTVVLLNLGFRSWLFTGATGGVSQNYLSPPPGLATGLTREAKPVEPAADSTLKYECKDSCEFTANEKAQVASWRESYDQWKTSFGNPSAVRQRDAVAAVSFLLVSIPLFLLHLRLFNREAKTEVEPRGRTLRSTYFYLVSLAALLMVVVSAGFLINLGLKTWVFPQAGKVDEDYTVPKLAVAETYGVQSIVTCAEKCSFAAEDVQAAKDWLADYDEWKVMADASSAPQRQASTTFPFFLVGIPLFWYHWTTVRKESKEHKESPPTSA